MSKQRNAMTNDVGKFKSAGGWNKFKRERPVKLPAPQFDAVAPSVSSEATTPRGEQAGRRNPRSVSVEVRESYGILRAKEETYE
jgi:hypothetical protein